MKHSHYFKDVRHLEFIDIYRVIDLWEVKAPPVQHAIKKLVVAGGRGHKDYLKDLQEVIDSVTREIEMVQENEKKHHPQTGTIVEIEPSEISKLHRYSLG